MDKQIIKQNQSVSITEKRVDISTREIIQIGLMPAISSLTRSECINPLIGIVAYAATISGSKIVGTDQALIANETYDRAIKKYPHVTIEEIRTAVKNGIYDEYGEYFSISPKSLMFFIQSYLESEKRRVAIAVYQAAKDKVTPPPPKLTKGEWKKLILSDYKLFKEGMSGLIFFDPKKYFLLEHEGMIKIKSTQSWENWLLRSKEERVYRKTHLEKLKGNKAIANEFSKIYNEFSETGEIPDTEIIHIENGARRLIYLAFFEKMAKDGIDNFFTQNPEP